MTLKELRAKLAQQTDQIAAVLKREETDPAKVQAQLDEVDGLKKTRTETEAEIARLEKLEEARRVEALRVKPTGPTGGHGNGDPLNDGGDNPPPAPFRIPAQARFGALRNFTGSIDGRPADERAYRFGMFALAALQAEMPNRFRFPKATQFTKDYVAALQQENDSTGYQVLVPEEFGTDMIVLRERYGVARRLFKMVPMSSDTRTDPRRVGGLTAYFVGEGQAGTTSSAAKDKVRLVAKKLMILTTISSELNEDAVMSIGDDLAGEISYAFANKEDECAFNGDGTSTYGGIYGVRKRLYTVGTAGVATQGTGSTWAAQVLADFHAVVGLLPQYADTPNAAWVCHRTYFATVMQKLELAAGGVTANEISQGDRRGRPLFLGYPVEFSQVFPSSTGTGVCPVILGDLSLAGSFGDRRKLGIAFSQEATVGTDNVFATDEIAVKGTERIDINVHDVGSSSAVGPVVGLKTS